MHLEVKKNERACRETGTPPKFVYENRITEQAPRLRHRQVIHSTKYDGSTLKKDLINPHTAGPILDLVKNVAPKSNNSAVHRVDYKQRTGRSVHAKEFVCWKLE